MSNLNFRSYQIGHWVRYFGIGQHYRHCHPGTAIMRHHLQRRKGGHGLLWLRMTAGYLNSVHVGTSIMEHIELNPNNLRFPKNSRFLIIGK